MAYVYFGEEQDDLQQILLNMIEQQTTENKLLREAANYQADKLRRSPGGSALHPPYTFSWGRIFNIPTI